MSISAKKIVLNPIHCLAFGLGSGLSPKAPGTAGSLAALPLYYCLTPLSLELYIVVLVLAFLVGIYLCSKTAKDLGVHDHPGIVWDEFVGMWISLLAVPAGWLWVVYAFVLFRLFDIWKPWPIRILDRKVHGGFGIMIDDVLAAVFALIVIQLTAMWI